MTPQAAQVTHTNGTRTWRYNGLSIEMSKLQVEPTERRVGRRRLWKLQKEFTMKLSSNGLAETVRVPAGFDTDFATLPLLVQLVLGNRDDYAEEAVLHDWLCATHVPGFIANSKMRCAMLVLGRSAWKRVAVFWGLQLFGYGSWLSRSWRRLTTQ